MGFSVMISMDGNSSLKQINASVWPHDELFDSRTIDSDHWLMAEEVDHFKDEVAEVAFDFHTKLALI